MAEKRTEGIGGRGKRKIAPSPAKPPKTREEYEGILNDKRMAAEGVRDNMRRYASPDGEKRMRIEHEHLANPKFRKFLPPAVQEKEFQSHKREVWRDTKAADDYARSPTPKPAPAKKAPAKPAAPKPVAKKAAAPKPSPRKK